MEEPYTSWCDRCRKIKPLVWGRQAAKCSDAETGVSTGTIHSRYLCEECYKEERPDESFLGYLLRKEKRVVFIILITVTLLVLASVMGWFEKYKLASLIIVMSYLCFISWHFTRR